MWKWYDRACPWNCFSRKFSCSETSRVRTRFKSKLPTKIKRIVRNIDLSSNFLTLTWRFSNTISFSWRGCGSDKTRHVFNDFSTVFKGFAALVRFYSHTKLGWKQTTVNNMVGFIFRNVIKENPTKNYENEFKWQILATFLTQSVYIYMIVMFKPAYSL